MRRNLVFVLAFTPALAPAADFVVSVDPQAGPVAKLAASELARYLGKLYPADRFIPRTEARRGERNIRLVIRKMAQPESFAVTPGEIAGADPRGVLFGVYSLLERLGCGFYLSYETVTPHEQPFSFAGWDLQDAPVFHDRFVFNWHNFLSSASTWDLEDWKHYIAQAAKMRFNGIMVHAYGNNPVFQFRYNGELKPVGYLATTRSGRDWGTQHVNDVRRLIGGEVFSESVFGAGVAKVPEAERAGAATALLKEVFAFARSRGLGVTFALDVDTASANPQNIIRTLPATARFRSGQTDLANPDTPEGYAYFKAQIAQLLETYPQISRLAIWFRNSGTPWTSLRLEELPGEWRREYEMAVAKYPALQRGPQSPGFFAVGKLIGAAGRALKELKRTDVELATGNWRLSTIPQWDPFIPPGVTSLPLDWNTVFETAAGQRYLRGVAPGRKMVPILWAHHDDRTYIGRPYTPFVAFSSLLEHSRSQGFGIIHWTTRPLDFYFKSLVRQTWKASRNESVEETAFRMAADNFGPAARAAGGEYLFRFLTEAPMFGRETTDRFMDIPLVDAVGNIQGMKSRLAMLDEIDAPPLSAEQRERLEYQRDYERFLLAFFESHAAWERAASAWRDGDEETVRREVSGSRAEETIAAYARAARRGRTSKGEEALIISLNLRWLPYVLSLRQALGMEPARIKFGPTQHEPLAQGAGTNTFFVDSARRLWKTLGEKETGSQVYEWSAAQAPDEFARTGLRLTRPFRLRPQPIMGDRPAPGRYALTLFFARGPDAARAEVESGGEKAAADLPAGRGELVQVRLAVESTKSPPELRVRPLLGEAYLAGVTMERIPQ